jgi:hypothetical protein
MRTQRTLLALLIQIASLIGIAATAAEGQTPVFNYINFTSVAELALHGDAVRVTERLRLTSASANKVGGVWFGTKRFLQDGFETIFQFQITGAGGDGPGEGFAFVIQNNAVPALGPAGGGLGYGGMPNSLAVEFDTFSNINFTDAAANHISIQSRRGFPNSADHSASLGVATNGLPAFADGNIHTARIVYGAGTLEVFVDDLTNAVLSVPLELETVLSLDNGQAWFGFTAATGGAFGNHDLLNWSFATAEPSVNITSPVSGASFISPANISMAASAGDGTVARVEFFRGSIKLDEVTNAPFGLTWNNVPPGAYFVTAVATDGAGRKNTSPPIKVTMLPSLPPIGINFSTGHGGSNFPLGASELTGVVPQRNWNNLSSATNGNGNVLNLKNGSAGATTLDITFDLAAPDQNPSVNASLSPAHKLMNTFLSVGSGGQTNGTLTVSGSPFAVYDVIVYSDGDNAGQDRVAEFRIGSNSLFLRDAAWAGVPGVFTPANGLIDAGADTPAGNYVRFHGLTNSSFTLTVTARSSTDATQRAVVNAVQIVPSVLSTAPTTPQLLRGPYLQMGTPTSVVVRWRTDRLLDRHVLYGADSNALTLAAVSPSLGLDHSVTLTNLLPDTRYYYAIGATGTNFAGGPDYSFVTAPIVGKPTRIWVLGDSGTANGDAAAVRNAYYNFAGTRPTDLWLMLGDNAYPNGTDAEYQAAVFNMYPTMLRQCVLWSAIGNHEYYSATGPESFAYLNIFDLPRNGEAGGVASGTEKFYSFNYGNIHFVCLDSMTSGRSVSGPMLGWLEQDLAANANHWLIAFWHHPPYTKGSHNSDSEIELRQMRESALPLLEAYGVDLVLAGHSHCYERSLFLHGHYGRSDTLAEQMIKNEGSGRTNGSGAYVRPASGVGASQGTVYVVAGSSGQATFAQPDWPHPAMFDSRLQLGSLVLDIDGERLDAKFLRETGEVADYFAIIKPLRAGPIRIASFSRTGGTLSFTWPTVPGTTYLVQRASNLMAPEWNVVSAPLVSDSNSLSWSEPINSNSPAGFYRIVMQ